MLSGHIHRAQLLPLASPVLYCGSAERTSFAEWREEKSFCDFRFARPGESPEITRIKLPSRTMCNVDLDGADTATLSSHIAAQRLTEMDRPIFHARVAQYLRAAEVRKIEARFDCTIKLVLKK